MSQVSLAQGEVHAKATLVPESSTIKPGEPFLVGVDFQIDPGWHIYYKEAGDAGMPTGVEWKLPHGFKSEELQWEKPHKFVDAGITTYGYSGSTLIAAKITPPADLAPGGTVKIEANLKWLTCKEICLPGKSIVSITVPVSTDNPEKTNAAKFSKIGFTGSVTSLPDESHADDAAPTSPGTAATQSSTPESSPSAASTDTATGTTTSAATASSGQDSEALDEIFGTTSDADKSQNILYFFGFALVGGFILNFMPCVLPVIAIKIMSFIEQADEEPARVRLLGIVFASGILSSFLVLALIVLGVRAAGQSVGWGFQFQYPGFVIIMSVIVLLLALSLFGLFYVNISTGQDKLDKLAQKEGFVGTFFKGVLATTLSTPCTAPFLGTALGFAFAQPDWVVVGIFLISGLGMSLPYLIFTAFPNLMKFFPKPGVWMEKFKESMGFVLMATVVWLLYVLGQQVGPEGQMWTSYFLLTIALASWIISRYTDLTSTNERKFKVWGVSVLLVAAGAYCFVIAQPSISLALAPGQKKVATATASNGEPDGAGLTWEPFTIDNFTKEVQVNKTIFLDFTADWCLTCKTNEKLFLSTDRVRDKMRELKVVTMKADWTTQDPDITKILNKLNRSGVPLYVVFPAGRPQDKIVLPEVINESLIVEALEKAGPSK
ncbi:MAG: thioredoxin family protein [Candidatus Obscuribacterales bacterium]|nr:thioredoxin family protein [Candidatus Obscuribacterales bacterium]